MDIIRFSTGYEQLYKNGYEILPIKPGEKRPPINNWREMDLDIDQYKSWAENGKGSYGIGIRLGSIVAIDIDVTDESAASEIYESARLEFGEKGISRIGQAPKIAYIVRTESTFNKKQLYMNTNGKEQKVEILASGQQIVIFAKHPITKTEYYYPDGRTPLTVKADELPVVSENAITEWLESIREQFGGSYSQSLKLDNDESFLLNLDIHKRPIKEIQQALDSINPDIDYDKWVKVGMALHEWDHENGFDLFKDWSEKGSKFKRGECESKWKSFSTDRSQVFSHKKLLKAVGISTEQTDEEKAIAAIENCTDIKMLRSKISDQIKGRKWESGISFDNICKEFCKKSTALSGKKISIASVRKDLQFHEKLKIPAWCADYILVQNDSVFFNRDNKTMLSSKAFDLSHNRDMLSVGDDFKKASPSKFITTYCDIEKVMNLIYMPGESEIFEMSGIKYANIYNEKLLPEIPDSISQEDEPAIKNVLNHIVLIFPNETESKIMTAWIAQNVKQPGVKIRWAPLIWGTEGDGKSFFVDLLSNIMGEKNVTSIDAKTIESQFSDWAHGSSIVAVEEIYIPGKNRHEILNALKPKITNNSVSIHPKGYKAYNAPNTANYIFLTNHKDAVPINEESRRFFVLKTVFADDHDHFMKFKTDHPEYYETLFRSISKYKGALRKFFLEYDIPKEFNKDGHAPETEQRKFMIDIAKPESYHILIDAIENGNQRGISRNAVSSIHFSTLLKANKINDVSSRRLSSILNMAGFVSIKELGISDGRIRFNGEYTRAYARKSAVLNMSIDSIKCFIETELKETLSADFNEFG
jgi:hypothetical protein